MAVAEAPSLYFSEMRIRVIISGDDYACDGMWLIMPASNAHGEKVRRHFFICLAVKMRRRRAGRCFCFYQASNQ